jgi:hypothetical protein
MKLKRREVFFTSTIAEGATVTVGPVTFGAGAKVTVVAAGSIVPAGNPDPVTVTTFTSGCPLSGDTLATSVTLA